MNYTTLLRWQQSHHHQWSWVPMTLHNVNVIHRVDMYWKIQHTMTAYFSSIYFQVTLNLFTSYHSINHKLNINRLNKWTPNNLILVFRFQLLFPWGHCSKTEKKAHSVQPTIKALATMGRCFHKKPHELNFVNELDGKLQLFRRLYLPITACRRRWNSPRCVCLWMVLCHHNRRHLALQRLSTTSIKQSCLVHDSSQ